MISKEDKTLLKTFVANKPLMEAVRRAMTEKIYEQGGIETSNKNFVFGFDVTLDDATYGQKVKVAVQALVELEQSFKAMVLVVADKPASPTTENEAR